MKLARRHAAGYRVIVLRVGDAPHFARNPGAQSGRQAVAAPTRAQVRLGLLTIAMLASATIATFTMNYLNLFATHTLGLSSAQAFGAVVVAGICGMTFNPVGGWLSDRIGRKPVMIGAASSLCAVSIPCFMLMSRFSHACGALCRHGTDGDAAGVEHGLYHVVADGKSAAADPFGRHRDHLCRGDCDLRRYGAIRCRMADGI